MKNGARIIKYKEQPIMKTIKIKGINIVNFKGIASAEFDFYGGNVEIIADVMQGKSTIKDAYFWALGIEIDNFYPVNKENQPIKDLESFAELYLNVDGLDYTLSRKAKIKYKNGAFDGFKKDMFGFDNVPCNTTEYKEKICELLGVKDFDTLKYLSILNYFNEQVNWKDRRALIYDLFVDNASIAELKKNPKYDLIAIELLKGKSSADISSMLNGESKCIGAAKNRNEILLLDKQLELNGYKTIDYNKLECDLEKVEKQISEEQARIDNLSQENITYKLQNEIDSLVISRDKLYNDDFFQKSHLQTIVDTLTQEIDVLRKKGECCEKALKDAKQSYKVIKVKTFDEKDTVCKECGRPLDEKDINALKSEWQKRKDFRLEDIKKNIFEIKAEHEKIAEIYINKSDVLQVEKSTLDALQPNPQIQVLEEKIKALKEELAKVETKGIDTSYLEELKSLRNSLIIELGKKDSYEKLKAKIEELINENKELVNSEIILAKKRSQLEQYTFDIISLVNDSINSHFNGVTFKLFEKLTATASKDIKETLVCLNNGIDYESQSTGQKANTNLIIVCALQKAFGVNLPIWLDDASILNLKEEPNNQLIYLLNEKGKKLNCVRIDEIY